MTMVVYPRLQSNWRKSSFSVNANECIEVGQFASLILIRDSLDQDGLVLPVSQREWRALVQRLKVE